METSYDKNSQTETKEDSLFATAVSEEELEEARTRNHLRHLFGSSKILLAPKEKHVQRADLDGSLIIQRKAAEHYANGKEAMGKSQYEMAVICFSKAITLQQKQTELHVSLAEAYLQLCDFQSAAACYKRARLLEPGAFRSRLAFIYYLQGQCLFDQGLFLEALEAFNNAYELKPDCRAYEVRSLACLTAMGHHSDCLQLVNEWMVSDGPTSDLYILRARLHHRLKQTSQCYQDVKSALALKPTCPAARALLLQLQEASEQARQKAVDRALSDQLPEAVCMISVALENFPQDARLYLFRGILHRRLKDFTAAIEDLVRAMELINMDGEKIEERSQVITRDGNDDLEEVEFQLVLTYNDYAVHCFGRGLYAEATLLLNDAIEEEKGQAGLYLNRGDCFFKQGEWHYALADYQQAEEMTQPNNPAVRLRLAVLYNTLGLMCFQDGNFQLAVDRFSLAIQYNPTASQYYENRSKAFRHIPNLKRAQQDFVCLLILDPTNEEVPPMLMSLFPGRSIPDILSSSEGRAVKVQLMDTIQTYKSTADQQKLSENLQKINLTSESGASQSQKPSSARKELKLCVKEKDIAISLKCFLKVLTEKHKSPL